MRIDRLDLIAFGPFTDTTLDLAAGQEGLHFVFGPNEAGKTSALRAIRQFFGGIPHQSTDDFVHDYKKMQVGVRLRCRDGSVLELVRRKGTKNTLLNRDGTPLDGGDNRLSRALGGLSAEDFTRRFLIDRDELVAGGRELIAGQGDLGRLLFAAGGGGLARVGVVQKALDERASELFLPRGSRPSINMRLGELDDLRKRRREAELPSAVWVAAQQEQHDRQAREAERARELEEIQRERGRWSRLAEALAPAARRREVVAALAALGPVPQLSDAFLPRYHATMARLPAAEHAAVEARQRAADLTTRLDALDVPESLLDQADVVETLHQRLGARRQSDASRATREAELGRVATELRTALRELGRDTEKALDRDDDCWLDLPRLTAADRAVVLELADQRAERIRSLDDARHSLDDAIVERRRIDDALAALGPVRDTGPLRKALKKAQAAGDLEALRDRTAAELRAAERQAQAALARLGRWSGTIEAAAALAVPSIETIETRQAEREAIEREAEVIDRARLAAERDLRALDAQLQELTLQGDVPSEETLAEARRRRDDAWHALAAARAWDEARAAAFLDAQRRADEQADRLRREADRVATRARLVADRARHLADRDECLKGQARIDQRRADWHAAWSALWAPLGLSDLGTPQEMKAWQRGQAELARLAETVAARRTEHGALGRQRDDAWDALAAALSAVGMASSADESLAERLERAQEAIDDARHRAEERRALESKRAALDAEQPARERAATEAHTAWQTWQARWSSAVGRLGLEPDATPAAAHAAVERVTSLFQALDRRRALRQEIACTEREAAQFADDLRALAAHVAPDLAPLPGTPFDPDSVATKLVERLKDARRQEQTRRHLTTQRDEALADERKHAEEITRLRDVIAALKHEARCDSDDEIPEVARRALDHRTLTDERTRLDDTLRKLAAGSSLDTFLAEIAATDADAIPPCIERLDTRIQALQAELKAINQAIGAGDERLSAMNGKADAAELRQQEEDLRTRIKLEVEEYARVRLAASVLRAGIERYRKKAQSPVLARASETFATLTLGSFSGLAVDYDDHDTPVLRGVRPDGSHVPIVPGMSLGTADQLYLSLRLATLEAALDRNVEPLPLIVDDILIQFDDARAAATLEVLAAFSKRTQVLLFTHHEHLTRLATHRLPPGNAILHRLPGRFLEPQG